jgi:hypothetical protein
MATLIGTIIKLRAYEANFCWRGELRTPEGEYVYICETSSRRKLREWMRKEAEGFGANIVWNVDK